MSWSAALSEPTPISELEAALADVRPGLELSGEPAEQFEAAKRAALAIATTGAVGAADTRVTVTLSGHANPGHAPAEGYANDQISLSVVQA